MQRNLLKVFSLDILIVIVIALLSLSVPALAEDTPPPTPLNADGNALSQDGESGFIVEGSEAVIDSDVISAPLYATHLLNPERTAVVDLSGGAPLLSSMTKSWGKGLRSLGDLFKRRSDGVLSRPVIYKDKLFTGSSKKRLYAFDVKSGKTLWSFKAESDIIASPSVTAEMICFGTKGGVVHCLKTSSGEELWNVQVGGEVLSAPIFTEGAVYFTSTDNRIYAFNRESGERLWVYTHTSRSYVYQRIVSSPAYSDGRLFVLFGDGVMVSLQVASGRLNWKERILEDPVASKASRKTPLIDNGRVYVIDDAGKVVSLSVTDGRTLQSYNTLSVSDFTISGDILYMTAAGQVEAVDKGTGAILWRLKLENEAEGRAIAIAGEYVVLVSNGYHKPLGSSMLTKRVGYVAVISKATGEGLWKKRLGSQVRSEPYLYDSYLAVVTVKGRLSVFVGEGSG